MVIDINVYGKDYTKVDFTEYKGEDSGNKKDKATGIEFLTGKELFHQSGKYNKDAAKLIVSIFLGKLRESDQYKKYIQKDERIKRPQFNRKKFLLTRRNENDEDLFHNIVGVLIKRDFKITKEDLIRYGYIKLEDDTEEKEDITEMNWKKIIPKCKFNIKLQIGSRFDNERSYFLPTMLLGNISDPNDLVAPMNEEDIYNFLLVYWYRNQLLESYIQGAYRTYTNFQNNDNKLKGSIDFGRHIKSNMGLDNGRIAYNYRENTADNHINYLFLYAFEYIKRFYPQLAEVLLIHDMEVSRIINELYSLCKSFEYSSLINTMNKSRRIISHPFYHKYDSLRRTSLMILQHLGVSMFDGHGEDVQGILFYVPDLWELYLEGILNSKFTIESQAKRNVYGDKDGDNFKMTTYPDYIFKDDKNIQIMILDAKYRIGWGRGFLNKNGILDDYTKCIRDMNTINVNGTGVIFPINRSNISKNRDLDTINYGDEYIKHKISKYNVYDNFYSFPIIIPESSPDLTYTEWYKAFNKNINNTINMISEAYKYEKNRKRQIQEVFTSMEKLDYSKENFQLLKENHKLLQEHLKITLKEESNEA